MENNNFIYSPSFGWGASAFSGGILGLLLGALFTPPGTSIPVYPTLPEATPEIWKEYNKACENASDEEKNELLKKYFDPDGLIDKYFEKLKDPVAAARLNSKLVKVQAKIEVLNKKKQEIVDKWLAK